MVKHPTKKTSRQDLVGVNRGAVQTPLSLLSALEDGEGELLGFCVESGKQVLAAMEEEG